MTGGIRRKPMQQLFDLLRELEQQKLRLTTRELERRVIAATSYTPKTWHTYRTKYLDGALIFPDEDDPVLLCVRGAVSMTTEVFAQRMTQSKRHDSAQVITTEESWREQMRTLAVLGRERKFMMPASDRQLFLGLFEKQRSLF